MSKACIGRVLFFCLILSGFLSTPLGAFQNEPQGFQGASWWSGVHRFSGLYPFESDGSWELYRREGESLLFGEARLDDVLYYFVKQRFAGVFLGAYGRDNRDLLFREAVRRWGEGKPLLSEASPHGYVWYGRTVVISLHYDPLSEESRLVMTPFFPWDSLGQDRKDLQRDFAVFVKGVNPVLRGTPFHKGVRLFAPGEDRYPAW